MLESCACLVIIVVYFIVNVTGDGRMDLWNGRVEDPNAAATALS